MMTHILVAETLAGRGRLLHEVSESQPGGNAGRMNGIGKPAQGNRQTTHSFYLKAIALENAD
jgi:hypothetical protein